MKFLLPFAESIVDSGDIESLSSAAFSTVMVYFSSNFASNLVVWEMTLNS